MRRAYLHFFSGCALGFLLVSRVLSAETRMRTWQPRNSPDVDAILISQSDTEIAIKDASEKKITLRMDSLGTTDLQYLRNVREAVNEFRTWVIAKPDKGMEDWPRSFSASFVRYGCRDAAFSAAIVELITDDYRRRIFPLRIFSTDDKAYAEKMRATADAKPKAEQPAYARRTIGYDPLKDKDVSFAESPHFLFMYGNDHNASGKAAFTEPEFIPKRMEYFEQIWNFYAQIMHAPMPLANAAEKTKLPVFITGTGLAKHKEGFAFGSEAMVIHPGAMGDGSSVVPHEFTHMIQFYSGGFRNNPLVGWFWECHANWSGHQFNPDYPPALEVYIDRAHYELNSSRMNYGSWPFLQLIAENPRFKSGFNYRIWQSNRKEKEHSIEDPFQTIDHLAVDEGYWHGDGVEDFGDLIGELAARMATWDFNGQYGYQRVYRMMMQNCPGAARSRVTLQPVPDRPGYFCPIYSHAPRQYGINIIELQPDNGVTSVQADFQGIMDESEGSDWRATLVAVNAAGQARYSRMWRVGKGELLLRPDEKKLYLAVAATPTLYKPLDFRPGFNKKRRYPYEVAFKGCAPRAEPIFATHPQPAGAPHPNGGGFVATSAKVAPTAYVGPNARVLENANVAENARIEDHATITGRAKISGHAIVGDWAVVRDGAMVKDNARVRGCAVLLQDAELRENARALDYVYLQGKGVVRGNALVKGWGELNLRPSTEVSGGTIFGEDLEVHFDGIGIPRIEGGLIYGFMAKDQFSHEVKDNHYLYAHWDFAQPRKQVLKDAFADCDGILRNAPEFIHDGAQNALKLNGRDQYALVEKHVIDTSDITLDMQLKWFGGEGEQCVFDFGSADSSFRFTPKNANGHAALISQKGTQSIVLAAKEALPINKWAHVIITLKGNNGRIWIDGVLLGSADSVSLHPEDIRAAAGYLGRRWIGGGFFNGLLGEVSVYRLGVADPKELPR